jgi:hypothetical protein
MTPVKSSVKSKPEVTGEGNAPRWQDKVAIGEEHAVGKAAYRSWEAVTDYRKRDHQGNIWDYVRMGGGTYGSVIVRKVASYKREFEGNAPRVNTRCTYCGNYVRPSQRSAYVGYEENLLCPNCEKSTATGEGNAPSDISRHARKRDERGLHMCGVALCGSSSRRTWTDETVTCPKCLRLLAKEVR